MYSVHRPSKCAIVHMDTNMYVFLPFSRAIAWQYKLGGTNRKVYLIRSGESVILKVIFVNVLPFSCHTAALILVVKLFVRSDVVVRLDSCF